MSKFIIFVMLFLFSTHSIMKGEFTHRIFQFLISVSFAFLFSFCAEETENDPSVFELNPNVTYDSVYDIDGNIYHTVTINSLEWMAENLKVSKLNDGTLIPEIQVDEEWASANSPAYCLYNNDYNRGELYGSLYNWYTVETEKVCPQGWHVPSAEEWTSLEDYLINNGYNYDGSTSGNKISKALASSGGWRRLYQEGVTGNVDFPEMMNKTGFTGVPGGHREEDGYFIYSSVEGEWWSSTKSNNERAIYRFIFNNDFSFGYESGKLNRGVSIRCLKDY